MGIEIIELFSVYLDLPHWEKEFIDEFTAVENNFFLRHLLRLVKKSL